MKVLVIQQRYGIGDMVILLPYIHAISKKLNTPVSLLAKESSKAFDLLAEDKHIKEIITLDKERQQLIIEKPKYIYSKEHIEKTKECTRISGCRVLEDGTIEY